MSPMALCNVSSSFRNAQPTPQPLCFCCVGRCAVPCGADGDPCRRQNLMGFLLAICSCRPRLEISASGSIRPSYVDPHPVSSTPRPADGRLPGFRNVLPPELQVSLPVMSLVGPSRAAARAPQENLRGRSTMGGVDNASAEDRSIRCANHGWLFFRGSSGARSPSAARAGPPGIATRLRR